MLDELVGNGLFTGQHTADERNRCQTQGPRGAIVRKRRTGTDDPLTTAEHLASMADLYQGPNESAGKVTRSSQVRVGNTPSGSSDVAAMAPLAQRHLPTPLRTPDRTPGNYAHT